MAKNKYLINGNGTVTRKATGSTGGVNWRRVTYWGLSICAILCIVGSACLFTPARAEVFYYALVAAGVGLIFGVVYLGDPYYGKGWHK